MPCTDPFVEKLKEKGYHLLANKKTSVKTLEIYQSEISNKFKRKFIQSNLSPTSGTIKDLFIEPEGAIGTKRGISEPIDTIISKKQTAEVGAKEITKLINELLPKDKKQIEENTVKAMLGNTSAVVFKIDEIEIKDINELALKNYLNANQRKLQPTFKTEIENGELYVVTSLMRSKKISMTMERSNKTEMAANIAQIMELPISGKFDFKTESSEQDKLIYDNPSKGIVFAVRLSRITFSKEGILTIDKREDYNRVLSANNKIDPDYFISDETFLEFE